VNAFCAKVLINDPQLRCCDHCVKSFEKALRK